MSFDEIIAHISEQTSASTTSKVTSNPTGSIDPVLTALNEVVLYSEQKPLQEVKFTFTFAMLLDILFLF